MGPTTRTDPWPITQGTVASSTRNGRQLEVRVPQASTVQGMQSNSALQAIAGRQHAQARSVARLAEPSAVHDDTRLSGSRHNDWASPADV